MRMPPMQCRKYFNRFTVTPPTSIELPALLQRTLVVIRSDFDDNTWQAFWRLTVEGHAAGDIAVELGISPGAVRQAKYRVLCRLREEMGS